MTPQPPRARPTAPASRGQADASVLVIDDNRLVRQLVRATFEPEGYAVIEAANGQSALQLFVIGHLVLSSRTLSFRISPGSS